MRQHAASKYQGCCEMCRAWRMFRSDSPTRLPMSEPTSSVNVGRAFLQAHHFRGELKLAIADVPESRGAFKTSTKREVLDSRRSSS